MIERRSRASANAFTVGSRPSIVLEITVAVSVTCGVGGDGGIGAERVMPANPPTVMGPGVYALVDGIGATVEADWLPPEARAERFRRVA